MGVIKPGQGQVGKREERGCTTGHYSSPGPRRTLRVIACSLPVPFPDSCYGFWSIFISFESTDINSILLTIGTLAQYYCECAVSVLEQQKGGNCAHPTRRESICPRKTTSISVLPTARREQPQAPKQPSAPASAQPVSQTSSGRIVSTTPRPTRNSRRLQLAGSASNGILRTWA
jgi:hypothetical protein